MQKDTKKIIMNVIYAFAIFNLFTIFCSLLLSITEAITGDSEKYLFVKYSFISCFITLIPIFGLFISKFFVRNKIINILENVFVIILIVMCVGFLIAGNGFEGNIISAQKIDLTTLLAVSCLYEFYLAYDLINVSKEEKEVAKKETEE